MPVAINVPETMIPQQEEVDDRYLTEAIRRSDHRAMEIFFHRHYESVFRLVWRLVRNTEVANDLTQEAFVKLWEMRERLDPGKSVVALLHVAARNRALSWLRRPVNRQLSLEEVNTALLTASEEESDLVQALHWFIGELDEPLREVVVLRLRGFKDREIADLLGIAVATVDKRKTRAFQFLREKLAPLLTCGR